MECKNCNNTLCSYRTSDAEKDCFYERHPDYPMPIDKWDNDNTDWQSLRNQAAIAAMQGVMNFFGSIDYNKETIAKLAVEQADALIDKLKEKISAIDIQQSESVRTNTVSVNKDFFHRDGTINIKNSYWHCVKIGFDIDCSKYPGGVLDLLYAVLFKDDKALVYNYLSEENPLIYSYDSTLEQYDNVGNMNFKFEVEKNNLENAIKTVVLLLQKVKTGEFNFEASLKSEIYSSEMEIDRPDDLNWNMAYYNHILTSQPIDYSDEFYGRLRVSKEQVIEAAKEIFQVRNMTIAIKGDKKKINSENIEEILKTLD